MAENAVKISDLVNGGLPLADDKFEIERSDGNSLYVEFGDLLNQKKLVTLPADINLNNITEDGVYDLRLQTTWTTSRNYPVNNSTPKPDANVPILIVYKIPDKNSTVQIFYYSGSMRYSRKRSESGNWATWVENYDSSSRPSLDQTDVNTGTSTVGGIISPKVLKDGIEHHAGNLISQKIATPTSAPANNDFRVYTITSGPTGGAWTANTVTATMGSPSGAIGAAYGELVRRDAGGTVRTPTPVQPNDAANKEYADNIVREKLADTNELPWNIGDSVSIDSKGISRNIDLGPISIELPYVPVSFGITMEPNKQYFPVITRETSSDFDLTAFGVFDITLNTKRAPTDAPDSNSITRYNSDGSLNVVEGNAPYSVVNYRQLNSRIRELNAVTLPTNNRTYVPITERSGTTYTPSYTLLSEYSASPSANEIARYGTGGRLRVNKAIEDHDAVNLAQLHTFIPAHTEDNYPGNGTWYIPVVVRMGDTYTTNRAPVGNYGIAPYRGMVVAAGDDGRIRASDAVEDYDVVTKGQADSTYVKNNRITISTADPSGGVNGDIWFKV